MKTFIVLGMHRSATSLVAKGLYHCMFMGRNILAANDHNPFGYYEDADFVTLNDNILKAALGSWNNPPTVQAILDVAPSFAKEIKDLIAKKEEDAKIWVKSRPNKHLYKEPLWGWKDPRTVLTIQAYMPYLSSPHFVCLFRNPKEVAKSLGYGDDINLVKIYNERILEFIKGHLEKASFC